MSFPFPYPYTSVQAFDVSQTVEVIEINALFLRGKICPILAFFCADHIPLCYWKQTWPFPRNHLAKVTYLSHDGNSLFNPQHLKITLYLRVNYDGKIRVLASILP